MKVPIKAAAVVALAVALVTGACSGDDDSAADSSTTASEQSTSSSTTSSTTSEPEATPEDLVAEAWARAWSTAAEADSTVETLAELASPDVAERLISTLHLGQDDLGDKFQARTVTNHPMVEQADDGRFTINDCLLISPSVTPAESNWYSGTIEEVEGKLTITSLEPEVATGCVPAEVAEEVYAVFDRYWELIEAGVRPGNSEFEAMITGEHETFILPLLDQAERDGGVLRQFDTQHPEIIEYGGGFVRVSSCADASPESGAYAVDGGGRLGVDVPYDHDGRNLYELHFVFEDGAWKLSSRIEDAPKDCVPAPTPLAIPEVGG